MVLADTIHSTDTLFDSHRIPRQIVVDEQVAELEVPTLTTSLGAYEHLGPHTVPKTFHCVVLVSRLHLTMKDVNTPTSGSEQFSQMSLGLAELSEYEHLLVRVLIEQLG